METKKKLKNMIDKLKENYIYIINHFTAIRYRYLEKRGRI